MRRILPIIWTVCGGSLVAAITVYSPFAIVTLVSFILGCIMEIEDERN